MTPTHIPKWSGRGLEIPVMGFGTSYLENCSESVATAIKLGYRLFDTARKYGTEEGVGAGVRASGVPRTDIFLSTKVSHQHLRAADFARSLEASLNALQFSYVDLLLINWPNKAVPLAETMGAMARAKQQGLTRHIGVCNFNIAMLKEAMHLCPEPLAVLQAEYHPYLDQTRLLAFCRETGLHFMAFAPIRHKNLRTDPVIDEIARARGKTFAQIALRWLIQQGDISPIPSSDNQRHIAENINIFNFTLTDDEMKKISALKRADGRTSSIAGYAPDWD